MFILTGCDFFGSNKFDGSEKSLNNMVGNLRSDEMADFIKDFELVVYVLGGQQKVIGYDKDKIRQEAFNIKEFAKNKNLEFLKLKLVDMQQKNQEKTYLHFNHGIISEPKKGFIYEDTYSVNDIEAIINNSNGDMFDYQKKIEFKKGFIQGCLNNKSIDKNLCLCVWDKMNINYSYQQLLENTKSQNSAYLNQVRLFSQECK